MNSKKAKTVEDVSKVFSKLVLQGKLSAATKLLDNKSSSGLLDLSPDVLRGLLDKHPRGGWYCSGEFVARSSWLHSTNVYDLMDDDEVSITTEGQRHLGAVIASQENKDLYCEEKIRIWEEEIERLSEIAKSHPHTAYIAFTKG